MQSNIKKFVISRRKDRDLVTLFWLGFVLYTVAYSISMTEQVSYIICQIFQSIGLLMVVITAMDLVRFKIENKYLQGLFFFYIIWLVIVVIRGISFEYVFVKRMLFDQWYGLLPYFTPLFIFFPKNLFWYKKVFQAILIFCVAFIVYDLLFLPFLMNSDPKDFLSQTIYDYFASTLAITGIFILFTYKYNSKTTIYLALITIGLLLFFGLVRGRRGTLALTMVGTVMAFFLYISQSKQKLSLILVSIVGGILLLIFGLAFIKIDEIGLFTLILERGFEDTRTGVEECLIDDLSGIDWLIGRGMSGEYYCPGIDIDNLTGYRDTMETDFLQYILKGGIISLALFLLISVPAMFKGLFQSKNLLSKAAGLWILFALLSMYPTPVNSFSMQYVLVWIAIGICYSKDLRYLPEEILVKYFKNTKGYSTGRLTFEEKTPETKQ